jgi:hypothetical protein
MWRRKLSQRRVPCRQSVRACVRPEGADADRNSPTSVRPAFVIGGVELVAREAEELGFDDTSVSDHLAGPKGQGRPAAVSSRPASYSGLRPGRDQSDRHRYDRPGRSAVLEPLAARKHRGRSGLPERWLAHRRHGGFDGPRWVTSSPTGPDDADLPRACPELRRRR